jgi:hypothetical protein
MIATAIILALGWFAAVNALTSVAAWVASGRAASGSRRDDTRRLLFIRLCPAGVSMVFALGMFLPSHFVFEPRDASETIGLLWYLLAAGGGALLARSSVTAWRIWRAGRLLQHVRRRASVPAIEVSEIDGLAGVSLAGVIKPRILIGRDVARELSPAELDVAIAHELAHRDARDNLARGLMLCAPDFLGRTERIRRLESAWHEASESLADTRAVGGDRRRALHLASALVKVARLTAEGEAPRPEPAWSTLIDPPLLERRVRHLLEGVPAPLAPCGCRHSAAVGFGLALALVVAIPVTAGNLHRLTEELVRLLP